MSSEKPKPNVGKTIGFEATEELAKITDENEHSIYVESKFFTGWIRKDEETESGEPLSEALA